MSAKISKIFSSQNFLFFSAAVVFLLSIFLRSNFDIGPDTAFYIELGKKISEGKKYYYDFFESNFPISFYIYALQHKVSVLLGVSPIIISEIFINILALSSILWSAKILSRSNLYKENRDHYNVIIIAFFVGFFLRINALQIGEFGTKTSLLLILFYPYLSYSLLEKEKLSLTDLVLRGSLIGLIPCVKPHYAIIVIIIELQRLWQKKSLRFFLEIDKLFAILVMVFYLNFLITITPEFLEFMVPMWRQFYAAYSHAEVFFDNFFKHLVSQTLISLLIFPIFFYIKFSRIDKILAASFLGAVLLLVLENSGTIDQEAIFYGIATICFAKFSYDFFLSKYFNFSENKFIILTLLFIPIFDVEDFFTSLFGLIRIWFIIVSLVFVFKKSQREILASNIFVYLVLAAISLLAFTQNSKNIAATISLISFLAFLFFYEKAHAKLHKKFSLLLIFTTVSVISYISCLYIASIHQSLVRKNYFDSPGKITDEMAYYIKNYANQPQDSYLTVSNWIAHQYPLMVYLNKENYFKYAVAMIYDSDQKVGGAMFNVNKPERAFVFSYLLDDFKKQLVNPNIKIIFVNQHDDVLKSHDKCNARLLEYYFQDAELRHLFFKNFHFIGRFTKYKKFDKPSNLKLGKHDVFSNIPVSQEKITHDFEVYLRNENDQKNITK